MHNNIMAAGSRDHPPMLATGRYAQWQSRFMRYINTRPNCEALKKCILQGPYKIFHIIIPGQPATGESLEVLGRAAVKTFTNISLKNKAHYDAEKEAIHLILTGIRDEIYSIVDACKTAHDMWIAIERLQQGESLNKQDVKTSLFWEFSRFTSRDGYTKSHKSYAPPSKQSYFTRSHATTKHKGKEIAKPITPPSESAYEEDNDPEQAQRDKDMQKNLALIAKYFKKIYKPTNNNLRTSSNTRNKNVDTSPRYKNDNQTWKPKRTKDYTYHKEKMLPCKQAEQGVPLQAEQADWLEDTDEEIDEQELEAHYIFMAKIQEVDSNVIPDSSDMCDNDNKADQNAEECDDERVVLANLIANLKLDTDENKKIQKQLKKANTSLAHELQKCKFALEKCKSSLAESSRTRDRYLGALHDKEVELEKYKFSKTVQLKMTHLNVN
ncbi:hypothetical protein Tco_0518903 [Tanacetum coccineum]